MQIFKVNKKIEIICETKDTRTAFKHVATLLLNGYEQETIKICYLNRTWESYTYESVLQKLAKKTKYLNKKEKRLLKKKIENQFHEEDRKERQLENKTIAMIAMMGNIFGKDQKEKNDWKTRMLKAGLQNRGLTMPEDWNELKEEEKENRLNKVIAILK